MKRFFSFCLVLALVLSLFPLSTASAATYSGWHGSLKWSLDTSTGVLVISGSGPMNSGTDAMAYDWLDYDTSIKTVVVEDGVTSVGDYAFYCYPNLTKVRLANSVTSVGDYAFYFCESLTYCTTSYLQSIGTCSFAHCNGLTSVTVSGQTTEMGSSAYYSCQSLTSVLVGNGAYIGSSAFANCSALSSVTFSSQVKAIGSSAFSSCPFSSVTLPEGLEQLGDGAFANCYNLQSITIPAKVSYIGDGAFSSCDVLEEILVADDNRNFKSLDGVLYTMDGTKLVAYPAGKMSYSFYGADTLTTIAPRAFENAEFLNSASFSSNLEEIGEKAFNGCYALRSVTFSGTVKTVQKEAFSDCTKLASISLRGVERIGKKAFDGCKSMSTVSISGSPEIQEEAFLDCYNLSSLDLGDTHTLNRRAFYGCDALRSVVLPASLTYVSHEAFGSCLGLKNITVLDPGCKFPNWESIETFWGAENAVYTFHGYPYSTAKVYADLYGHNFTSHSFNEDGKCSICGCEPYSYDDGYWSFTAGETSGVAYIYNFETVPSSFSNGTHYWHDFNYAITALVMGNDVKVIEDGAFKDQKAMTTLNLPYVEEIGVEAFAGCTALERLYLPDTMKILEERAFYGCTSLVSAVLRPGVESVYSNAFASCSSLAQVSVLNPDCYISNYICTLGDPEYTVICGFIPSTAYDYATRFGYEFYALDGCEYGYHNYETSVLTEAGCEQVGELCYTCTGCGHSYTEIIEALGHDIVTEEVLPTCTQEGYLDHRCSRCDYSFRSDFVPATGHSYVSHVLEPTCTEGGHTEYRCHQCGDSYIAEYTDPTGHNYVPTVHHVSCTEDGYTEYVCHGCGDSYVTDYITATGHVYAPNVQAPTCTEGGYTEYRCEGCGDSYIADYTDPLGHNYISVSFPATCTEEGYTEYHCEGCGDSYIGDYVPATGHIYTAFVYYPTCTQEGYTEYVCHGCGRNYRADYTSATGHYFIDGVCHNCDAIDPDYTAPVFAFSDVPEHSWFKEAVDFTVSLGLMNGTGNNKFSPNSPMTRAMLVTVLWRYEGSPEEGRNGFTDVAAGQWYTQAVAWAAHHGIVGGIGNNRFDPNGNITREQMAAILYRYCAFKGIRTDSRANLASFPDSGKISGYAAEPLSWANAEGLINGTASGGKTYLDPRGNATRAQVATILMRFIRNIGEGGGNTQTPAQHVYIPLLQKAMADYGNNVEGLLYDIDGNGVAELLLIFLQNAASADPYAVPSYSYSIYTTRQNQLIPLRQNEILYGAAAGANGNIGVVRINGEAFFATYCDVGEIDWRQGTWEIYRVNGDTLALQTKVGFLRYEETGIIDYARSFSDFNGERLDYQSYEAWFSGVTETESIQGYRSNLESLLAQLS